MRERLPQPAEHGVVVVRAGVGHAVFREVVRQVHVVLLLHKAELHHAHARQTGLLQQVDHALVDDAEILRDDLRVLKFAVDRVEEVHFRAVNPLTLLCRFRLGGHRPVRGERAEVVDAHGVEQLEARAEPVEPPAVAVRLHRLPVVERVAPLLSELAEIIRRHARDVLRLAVLREIEKMAVRPHVGAVARHIHRQVADDLHALIVGVRLDCLPLFEEGVLDKLHEEDRLGVLLHRGGDGVGTVEFQPLVRPVVPLRADIRFLQDDIQRVIRQPARIFFCERAHLIAVRFVCTRERPVQHRNAPQLEKIKRRRVRVRVHLVAQLLVGQKPLVAQLLEVDKIAVARECRDARIRRVVCVRRRERQHLPVGTARLAEKIDKLSRLLAKAADAVRARQRGDVHQHAACPLIHGIAPFF